MARLLHRSLIIAAAIAVALPGSLAVVIPAVAQSMDQTGGTTTFVRLAALGSRFEVESSQLALQRSRDPAVRGFAQHMIEDHTQALNDLKFTNDSNANASMPRQLSGEHQAMMNELQAAPPERFDAIYMTMQVDGHRKALAMYQEYARVGSVDSLKKLAVKTVPVIEQHLRHAQTVLGGIAR